MLLRRWNLGPCTSTRVDRTGPPSRRRRRAARLAQPARMELRDPPDRRVCKGCKGLQGVQGLQGDLGLQGVQGATGAAGADGRTVLNGLVAPTTKASTAISTSIRRPTCCTVRRRVEAGRSPACRWWWGYGRDRRATGATGAPGADGAGLPERSIRRAPRPDQPIGRIGPIGPTGATGADGVTGATGAAGTNACVAGVVALSGGTNAALDRRDQLLVAARVGHPVLHSTSGSATVIWRDGGGIVGNAVRQSGYRQFICVHRHGERDGVREHLHDLGRRHDVHVPGPA